MLLILILNSLCCRCDEARPECTVSIVMWLYLVAMQSISTIDLIRSSSRVLVWDIHAIITLDYHSKMIPLEFCRKCLGSPSRVALSGTVCHPFADSQEDRLKSNRTREKTLQATTNERT